MTLFGQKFKHVLVIGLSLFLAACASAPQQTVALNSNILAKSDIKIGFVYIAPEENATTHIYGAGCLLCYGVASSLTSKLDTHLEANISTDELANIKNLVIAQYAEKAPITEVTLPMPIDKLKKFKGELGYASKDFSVLKQTMGLDVLVVLQLYRHGAYRSFSSYVPNGDPQGYVAGTLFAIDLDTNAYVQYLEIDEKVQPAGEWDEPVAFPSVTTAYYQAIENVKAKLKEAI
ncbi:hypothetical protein [Flavobacterium sp. W21_SRS_FM6]|uniref:hypothetical protein n=1 Tax=Flavobacterium sp. W21_SRS_FM6 TaxID=3240268 RepID=UPI003F9371F8